MGTGRSSGSLRRWAPVGTAAAGSQARASCAARKQLGRHSLDALLVAGQLLAWRRRSVPYATAALPFGCQGADLPQPTTTRCVQHRRSHLLCW